MTLLEVLRDLMLGGKHSRRTVARGGVSLPTADRWLHELLDVVPGVKRSKEGKVSWFEWKAPAGSPPVTLTARPHGHRARARARGPVKARPRA